MYLVLCSFFNWSNQILRKKTKKTVFKSVQPGCTLQYTTNFIHYSFHTVLFRNATSNTPYHYKTNCASHSVSDPGQFCMDLDPDPGQLYMDPDSGQSHTDPLGSV